MHHPQAVQSPIENDFLKVKIDGYTEPKPVPNFLFHVSTRELHNNLVGAKKYGRLKKQDMKIIISLSVIIHYVHYCHPNIKKRRQYTRLWVVVNAEYLPIVCIHNYYHIVIFI